MSTRVKTVAARSVRLSDGRWMTELVPSEPVNVASGATLRLDLSSWERSRADVPALVEIWDGEVVPAGTREWDEHVQRWAEPRAEADEVEPHRQFALAALNWAVLFPLGYSLTWAADTTIRWLFGWR